LSKIQFDKWVHFVLFFVLVIAFCRLFRAKQSNKLFLWIAFLGLIYGVIMEFVQLYYIPYRSFDAGDIAADGLGCFAGYFFARKIYIKK
jgi:VanZ family protein